MKVRKITCYPLNMQAKGFYFNRNSALPCRLIVSLPPFLSILLVCSLSLRRQHQEISCCVAEPSKLQESFPRRKVEEHFTVSGVAVRVVPSVMQFSLSLPVHLSRGLRGA